MSEKKNLYSQDTINPEHPTITQSFLKMFEACPFAAHQRYILGKKVPPSGAATVGSSVDAGVTFGADTVIKTGTDATLKEKAEVAAATFERLKDNTDFQGEDPGKLKDETVGLVHVHHNLIAPKLKPVATQEQILIKRDKYNLAGTIDLIEENDTLADTKTANRVGKYVVEGDAQAAIYTTLYQAKYQRPAKAFRFDVLVKTKVPKVEMVEGEVTTAQKSLLDYRIEAALSELNHSMQTGKFRLAEQGHWRCEKTGKWCAYLSQCPKGKK